MRSNTEALQEAAAAAAQAPALPAPAAQPTLPFSLSSGSVSFYSRPPSMQQYGQQQVQQQQDSAIVVSQGGGDWQSADGAALAWSDAIVSSLRQDWEMLRSEVCFDVKCTNCADLRLCCTCMLLALLSEVRYNTACVMCAFYRFPKPLKCPGV